MSTSDLATLGVLIALQLLTLRGAQRARLSLYFTTSSFFETRAEVRGRAVLFRLSLPFAAGVLAALIVDSNEMRIASIAGAAAWFLAIWPVVWNPDLLPHSRRWPLWALLIAFWAAFAVLPVAGVASARAIESALHTGIDWKREFVLAAVTSVPIALVVNALARVANAQLSFADDEPDVTEEAALSGSDYEDAEVSRARRSVTEIATIFAVILLGLVWTLLRRGRRKAS